MSSYVKTVGDLSVSDEEQVETAAETSFNPVTKPSHYAGHTGIEDLKKAHECIENMLEALEGCAS